MVDLPNISSKMGWQRNIPQKNKINPQKKELNEIEATKIPHAEFKTIVVILLKGLRRKIDDCSESLNKKDSKQ